MFRKYFIPIIITIILFVSIVNKVGAQDLGMPTDESGMGMPTQIASPKLSPVPFTPLSEESGDQNSLPDETTVAPAPYDPYGVMGNQSGSCPMLSGTPMPGASGMSSTGMGMMSGMNMGDMPGMGMGCMSGMSSDSMTGMNMGTLSGMSSDGMSGMNMGNMAGMNMTGIEGGWMGISSLWYTNPWWLLGWVVLVLLSIAVLVGLVLAVVLVIRRSRPSPVLVPNVAKDSGQVGESG
jgi:hypothetical protein